MKVKMSFPLFGIMFLILFTLKLAEIGAVATWSWWAVTAPLWAPIAAFVGFFGIIALVAGICYSIAKTIK